MSQADLVMKDMLTSILTEGTSTKGQPNRPIWEDTGATAYTMKKFGVVNRYNLRKEFPAGTLRKLAFKSCVEEILWIWQKGSNSVNDLSSHIWDQWVDKDNTIGKAYGYQVSQVRQMVRTTSDKIKKFQETTGHIIVPPEMIKGWEGHVGKNSAGMRIHLNQTDYILFELMNNPYSRRIIGNLYNIQDLDEMQLHPCCYSITLNATEGDNGKMVLNMILNQRSLDTIVAGAWNVAQYAVLLSLFAHFSGMEAGELIHVIADAHIYDRHFEIAEELISRTGFPAPKLWINPECKSFYDVTVDDVKLLDYESHEAIKNIPVAK